MTLPSLSQHSIDNPRNSLYKDGNREGSKALKAHEYDDGTVETVDVHPRRRTRSTRTLQDAAKSRSGGRLTQTPPAPQSPDFINIRTQLGAAKIAQGHLQVFSALWRLWAAKRVEGGDAGVTVAELADSLTRTTQKVHGVLTTLIRNGIVRSIRTNVGWSNVRASYYPTELGVQILALTQALGPGSSVQIGRTATAWSSRSNDEPENFFRHAALMRGSAI